MFPPGRARLATKPDPRTSATLASTMGILRVARRAASAASVPEATMMLTFNRTSSAAISPARPGLASAVRHSTARFFPSTYPSSRRPRRNASMLTFDTATHWGFADRGLIREGFAADLVVFDPETIGPEMPEVVNDLPAGAKRLTQRCRGIAATVVNGEVLLRDGKHTGALPGRLLRGPLARTA